MSNRAAQRSTRRALNTPLLLGSIILLAVVGGTALAVHQYFASQIAATFLQRAETLEKEENWVSASAYLGRYLQLNPADLDARMRLLTAVENSATTDPGRNRLTSLLYQMVGSLPDRTDLRAKLVEQLLDSNRFKAAEEAARELSESDDPSQQQIARRATALSKLSLAREDRGVSFAEAAQSLRLALERDPGDIRIATTTAYLLREKPDEIGPAASAEQADQILDGLVAAKPNDVDARLVRYQYRSRFHLASAQEDLEAARKIAPERIDVLLLSADSNLQSGDKARQREAEVELQNAIKIAPTNPLGYLSLARFYATVGRKAEAIETLQQGRARLTEPSADVLYSLAQLQLEAGNMKDAAATASEFTGLVNKLSPQLSTASRIQVENMRRSLDSKIAYANKDFATATRDAEAIIVAGEKAGDAVDSNELLDAYAMLATMMSQANRPEQAAAQWVALSDRSPGHRDAAMKAALALLAIGRSNDAISHIERYRKLPNASPEADLILVQLRLQEQLSRPVNMRDWTAFKDATKSAESKLANRWELAAAKVVYLAALNTEASRQAAFKQLHELESSHADKPAAVERLVVFYRQLGQKDDAERVVREFRKSPNNAVQGAILQAGLLAAEKQNDEALQVLEEALAQAPELGRRDLELARFKLLLAAGKSDAAQQALAKMINDKPKDAQLLSLGIEIALLRQDFEAAQKWEAELQSAPQIDDFDWQFFKARRLVAQFGQLDQQQRSDLEQLVPVLQAQRPAWAPMLALTGRYAELRGDQEAAIEAYRSAISAGDRRPETLQLFAKALYAARRFDEAKELLSKFDANSAVQGQLESLAIVAAAQDNRLSEARTLAQQAVDRKSQDPLHYIWLANLDYQAGDQAAAETTFRNALERFPRDSRVWNAIFLFFVETKQIEKARIALQRWTERVPLDKLQKEIVLGDGELALGDRAAAQRHYEECIRIDPRSAPSLLRLAKLHMESDVNIARKELDAVLQIEPSNAEARQYLAAVLAATGSDADWSQAVQLLERTAGAGDPNAVGANDRLHAILLARKGKNQKERQENYQQAQAILTKRLALPEASGPAFDMDRMLLAGIYEQQANFDKDLGRIALARDVLRPLVERTAVSAEHLLFYIQLLMRNLSNSPSAAAQPDVAEMREIFATDVRNRIEELERLLEKDPQGDQKSLPTALRVRLLTLEGKQEEGKKLIEEYADSELANVSSDSERAKVFLRIGGLYQSAQFNEDAERWFRKLVEITPSGYVLVAQSLLKQGKTTEAVDFCIGAGQKMPAAAVATVLAQILSSERNDQVLDRKAQPLIDAALDQDRGNVDLLMSVAVQRVTRNDLDEAASLFKRVIQLQPNHTLALNNLATLYAEQPEHLGEAQQYVERAMAVAGRNPALLDTLGTILLRAGKYDEAVVALEESVAGSVSDPRYYFHLAAAYEGAKQPDKAKAALNTAVEMGLDKAILTEGDRKLLASLKQQLLAINDQN